MPQMIQSREKKTDGIELEMTFLDPGTEINGSTPRKMKTTLWKSSQHGWAYFKIKEACEAFGVPYDEEGFDSDDFLNTEAKVSIEQVGKKTASGEEYVGNEVGKFLKP